MILLIQSGTLTNDKVAEAVRVTFECRKTHASSNALPLPPAQWQKPHDAVARECGISGQVEDAFAVLRFFLKPILGS
jgi:hypothetical protein